MHTKEEREKRDSDMRYLFLHRLFLGGRSRNRTVVRMPLVSRNENSEEYSCSCNPV